jgi:malonyl CoA-acyl carrier protein transacylase
MNKEPIAITGIGCRFPGAKNPTIFWKMLCEGVDAINQMPRDRWNIASDNETKIDVTDEINPYVGGFLEQIDQFDPQFFGISPREANSIDPHHRLLLEVTWEALEDAGQITESLYGTQTGVFIGISSHEYFKSLYESSGNDLYAAAGTNHSMAANRISYFLNLTGPSITVNTACSSSLVAVHLACQSLWNGESSFAFAGGVNLLLSPKATSTMAKAGFIARDGRCKTFDARANGYVRSEGAGVVLLKPLSQAIANSDSIYAVIRSSAVNQDGRSNGITAPNLQSQKAVLLQAYQKSGISPGLVQYVEVHGTGTKLGDPLEIKALGKVISEDRSPEDYCAVGSVKTNIGHLEAAAGIAGLIKVALSLKYQQIPPSLHFQQPNPYIPFDKLPLKVQTTLTPWPKRYSSALAGVSSFGFGGTNSHVVLEESPTRKSEAKSKNLLKRPVHLLTLSAKTEKALEALVFSWRNHLETYQQLAIADICFTANTRRSHFSNRLAIISSDKQELANKLAKISARKEPYNVFSGQLPSNDKSPSIAFLFTGQGSQYINMGRQLYETQPVFRRTLDQCEQILQSHLEKSILNVIYLENTNELNGCLIDQTAYAQPALFAIEYALFILWQSWGIEPDVVIGHSVGEYVAACVAGVFSLEDGLKLIAHRGRLMQQLPSGGEMIAVKASFKKINQLIAPYKEKVAIAAINGPESIVISGAAEAIGTVRDSLEASGIKTKQLQVSHGFHSPLMKPMLAEFQTVANQITYNQPLIPLVSNVTGNRADESIATTSYWVNHIRQPVKFAQSIETLHQEGYKVFLEIGPKPILLGMGRQCLPEDAGVWLPSLRPGQEDWQQMLHSLGQLYVKGVKIDWAGFYRDYDRSKVILPTYPFQRQRYWIETDNNLRYKKQSLSNYDHLHPLLGQRLHLASLKQQIRFECFLSTSQLTYLKDHCVFSQPVFPGAGYLEIALAAGATLFNSKNLILEDVVIQQALILPEDEIKTIQVILIPQQASTYSFEIFSLDNIIDKSELEPRWSAHARGKLLAGDKGCQLGKTDLKTIKEEYHLQISPQDFYQEHQDRGINYGSSFQAVQQLWHSKGKALGQIKLPETLVSEAKKYQLHPVLLDASFQVLAAALDGTENKDTYLPVNIKRLQVYRSVSNYLWTQVKIGTMKANTQTLNGEVRLLDEHGIVLAQVEGLTLLRTSRSAILSTIKPDINDWLYQIHWQAQSTAHQNQSIDLTKPGSWLLFSPPTGIGLHLASSLKQQGQHCILVTPGDNYQQLESQHYQINPLNASEFPRLLQESLEQQPPLRGIVHLWSCQSTIAPSTSVQELNNSQELGCGSVLHLVQALVKNQASKSPPTLWLVTQGSQSVGNESLPIQCQQAPLWGLGRVIAQEHRELQCRCLDLDPTEEDSLAVTALLQELLSLGDENQIAYRQRVRHVIRLERQQKILTSPQVSIQPQGNYLITGGLGALGLNTAKWMVKQGAKYLVLTGRRQPSEKARETIQELQEAGAQVLVLCGDISQKEDVTKIFKEIEASSPRLRGIIHAAGVLDDGLLQQMSWEQFTRVMAPKVQGAWHLHHLTKNQPLDFFVCFSSIASLLGSPGQGNYAAANAFMDALAHRRRKMGLPGLSINWGSWGKAGMAASLGSQHQNRMSTQGISPISPERGLQVLANLLTQDSTQVAVLPVNWPKFIQQFTLNKTPLLLSEIVAQERPRLEAETPPSKEKSELLKRLKQAQPSDYQEILVESIGKQVSKVLGLNPSQFLDPQQPLSELGLDSLIAIELRNNIEAILDVSLPIVNLLQGSSISQLVSEIYSLLTVESVAQYPLVKVLRDQLIPLSSLQERYWFIAQTAIGSLTHISLDCRIIGPLDIALFERCINEIIRRHEPLRTTFSVVDGYPFQIINPSFTFQIPVVNLQELSEEEWSKEVRRLANEQEMQRFDLTHLPLLRATILKRSDEEYVLLLTLHHIVSDIWSVRVFIEEIKLLYEAFAQNKPSPLPELTIQHADFAHWERQWLQGEKLESLLSFWRQKFGPNLPQPILPTKNPKASVDSYCGARQFLTLSKFVTDGLNDLSLKQGVSLFTTLLTAFKTLLYRCTKQDDIFVGSPCANRTKAEFHELIGFFAHVLYLRTNLSGNPTFLELQARVSEVVYQASEYQDLPTGKLIQELYPDQYLRFNELLQVQFNLLPISYDSIEMSDVTIQPLDGARTKVSFSFFDLSCIVVPKQDELQLIIFYNTLTFEDSFISNTFKHFQNLLEAIVVDPEQRILNFPM